jgi:hypothetical protein
MKNLGLMQVQPTAWYQSLIEDCQAIITEKEYNARWELIECYHLLGKRILQEYDKFEKLRMDDSALIDTVSISIGRSPRTVYRAIRFARVYPDLQALPEGKNVSWYKICNKYLGGKNEEKTYSKASPDTDTESPSIAIAVLKSYIDRRITELDRSNVLTTGTEELRLLRHEFCGSMGFK